MKKFLVIGIGLCFLSMPGSAVTHPSFNDRPFAMLHISIAEFISLSPKEIEKRTGKKLTLREKISMRIIKIKMKKAARKEPGLSVREFLSSTKHKSAGTAILYILLGALLVFFVLFLMLFTDSNR